MNGGLLPKKKYLEERHYPETMEEFGTACDYFFIKGKNYPPLYQKVGRRSDATVGLEQDSEKFYIWKKRFSRRYSCADGLSTNSVKLCMGE